MTTKHPLILIQGVHLDSSVWDKTRAILNSSGLHTKDLNRLGRDENEPASLKKIAELAAKQIPDQAVLVGHSYGGAIVNAIFGVCPEKIAKIIYVTAVGPLRGELPFDKMSKEDQAVYQTAVDFAPPKIFPKEPKNFFSQTDPTVDLNSTLPRLYPEWMTLAQEPLEFDLKRFTKVPKAYIHTTNDPVLSTATQKLYTSRTPVVSTEEMATGHFPMISDPDTLAELLIKLA